MGFLYLPPFRVQGISVAGEEAVVQIPELDIVFDIGLCPRPVLGAKTVALSHAHMDHVAALPYWFSQRYFQKHPPGRVVCHHSIAGALDTMMKGWVDLERQRTPYEIVPLAVGQETELQRGRFLRALEVSHTVPALGYVVVERRRKLKAEYTLLSQAEIRDLRSNGVDITVDVEIPLVAYTGDTSPGDFLLAKDFVEARILIVECTFFDPEHGDRARVGQHIHINDLARLLPHWKAEHVVVVHVSRRTPIPFARECLAAIAGDRQIHLLMDGRTNRARYEQQLLSCGPQPTESAVTDEAK
ncbi:MAG: MBL fold metallo-hydrolase [Planctomycetota bacterium]|nr:MBL fold metallo-hydrolase [Planctomycetota bacterium]